MTSHLPESLQPTAADIAYDNQLAAEAREILKEAGVPDGKVKTTHDTYNAVTFGADGKPVARVRNGVPMQSHTEEAVARAQSAANAEVMQIERNIQRLVDQRDEIRGYDNDGNPRYVRPESDREHLTKQIRQLRLGVVNQKRFNERRWRNEVADTVRQADEDRITAAELARELQAKGRVQRIPGW